MDEDEVIFEGGPELFIFEGYYRDEAFFKAYLSPELGVGIATGRTYVRIKDLPPFTQVCIEIQMNVSDLKRKLRED